MDSRHFPTMVLSCVIFVFGAPFASSSILCCSKLTFEHHVLHKKNKERERDGYLLRGDIT